LNKCPQIGAAISGRVTNTLSDGPLHWSAHWPILSNIWAKVGLFL